MAKRTLKEIEEYQVNWFNEHVPYRMTFYNEFNYVCLERIRYLKKSGRGTRESVSECFIMIDTETSKKRNSEHNHIVAWTISIRAYNRNIVTLWGRKPSELITCLKTMLKYLKADSTIMYIHNLSYDYLFLRRYLYQEFGYPLKQLNIKSHYPIYIKWANFELRDSLILAQCSLERWARNMNVEHQKAVGFWDYDKIRNQNEEFTPEELKYIENDTLAGVECLDALKKYLGKKAVYAMPYTSTGILREHLRKVGKENRAHDRFMRMALSKEQYDRMLWVFHGGFTHANRHLIDEVINNVKCFDEASAYPYAMLSERYPMEQFTPIGNVDINYILRNMNEYAFVIRLILINPVLKEWDVPMPCLQFSKCRHTINAITDNGRIIKADYVEIDITEQDLYVIQDLYTWDAHICSDVEAAKKEYLPRWFTDIIYDLFKDKCTLKGIEDKKVEYAMKKATLNSAYGCTVQKSIRELICENYESGDYYIDTSKNEAEEYEKYIKNFNSILPYQWGVWVTAYAFRNIFEIGKCINYKEGGEWIYTDTDSCYSNNWDIKKLEVYNETCKQKLLNNNYGAVIHNGREYWLGVCEFDGEYSEFKALGAKRYCGRSVVDQELHITVAGVPKRAAVALKNDINLFRKGFLFDGVTSGKKQHTYFYSEPYIDSEGNETADSINLTPCDYLLDDVKFEDLFMVEAEVQVFD